MSVRNLLKNSFLFQLNEKLNEFGFDLSRTYCEFTNKKDFGWCKFQIVFLVRDYGWEINIGLLMRFDVVENLFHEISEFERKYQKRTPTIGVAAFNLINSSTQKTKFELSDENQITTVVDEIFEIFENVALPFFEKFNTLDKIDNHLNSDKNDTLLTGSIFKGTKSLITAKLTNRNDYYELEKYYFSYYENFADGFYLPEYIRLKELLNTDVVGK